MRPHMRMDARSYAERGIAGGAGMRRSAADAPRATVGSTDPNAERTAAKRGGARSGRPRRQSRDCRAGRTQAPTPLFVPGVRLGRYCPQIRGKHCMDRRYEKKWVNSRDSSVTAGRTRQLGQGPTYRWDCGPDSSSGHRSREAHRSPRTAALPSCSAPDGKSRRKRKRQDCP